ncbi:hypothetical protein JYK14_08340 [Siccirubricoccus sp. KC 17139]|uniref:Pentapeptide MXKDX repeat protein n=1 Tax=Siccirubricoccus soli TaxID=2899147 RepID=A0ABT1D590_9PROT|nr:hypothetical protein [Siccirubricoccus soli]MCO6416175.1 hypothetical protein [Siccirubricoccus soli]MCP2682309.1 hypothetical protein [Siccirubricoccus soli]
MTTKRIPMAAAAALLATALGATVALAQGNQAQTPQAPAPQQAPAPDQGMMGRGGMMGMMNMMGQMDPAQMNRMMENCNRMMEGMQRSPSAPRDTQPGHG